MYSSLNDALKYATKVRASAADYHKAFDRLAADPKAEQGVNEKALVPTEFFADHLRSEGHHPQADLIAQSMKHAKEQGEPVVYAEAIDKFPPHHREALEGLGQGDFHLVLGKPRPDYTNAVLYQRSHTDPSKVFGWTDSIEGSPDEVKAEVERFRQAGVPVELAMGPDHKEYSQWAKHFGLSGCGEEPEQYAKKSKRRPLSEIYAEYRQGTDTEGWTEEEKKLLEAANKNEEQRITRAGLNSKEHHAALANLFGFHHRAGRTKLAKEIEERMEFLKVPLLGTVGEVVPYDPEMEATTGVPEGSPVRVLRRGVGDLTHPQMPFLRTLVTPEVDKEIDPVQADAGMGNLAGRYGTLERALKYIQETHADFHNRIVENPAETTPPLVYADWLEEEQGKPAHAELIRKHVEQQGQGPQLLTKGRLRFQPQGGLDNWIESGEFPSTFALDSDGVLELQQNHTHSPANTTAWRLEAHPDNADLAKRLQAEGAVPSLKTEPVVDHNQALGLTPNFGEQQDAVSEHFSAADKPLRYSAVPEHEVHEDYAPNGIAPRIGHTLKQLAQEDSTTGALAEGILRTGDHSILPILADRLEETDHPLAQAFDWRHAPRAIRIDKALQHRFDKAKLSPKARVRTRANALDYLDCLSRGERHPLSKADLLLSIAHAAPDAKSTDLLHSALRLAHTQYSNRYGNDSSDWVRELIDARQKNLQVAGDPHRYEDTRKPNRRVYRAEKVRYSHEAFQQAVAKDPSDWTSGLVYADWLEEQGMPTHARVVREGAATRQAGWGMLGQGRRAVGLSGLGPHNPLSVSATPLQSGRWILSVHGKHIEGQQPEWHTTADTGEAQQLVKGLLEEGADNHILNVQAFDALVPKKEEKPQPEPSYADTKKYGSWRAPAGGMVVQQSPLAVSGQWAEGGEFVNDLQKMAPQPVDYKRPKKRLTVEYLRQHFRKRRQAKGSAGVRVLDDTEGDAGAEAGAA